MADQNKGGENPSSSPDENQLTQGADANQNLGDPSSQEPSVEQAEWEKLSGKSQDRFSAIIRERNEVARRLEELEQAQQDNHRVTQQQYQNPQWQQQPQGGYYQDPREQEVEKAVQTLKQKGFVTVDDARELVNDAISQTTRNINLDREHEKLEAKYNSNPNAPRYSREEVEDYGRRNNIFNLEAAYRDMYWDELHDLDRSKNGKRSAPVSERPGASNMTRSDGEPMSLDQLQQKLRGPQGREWYAEQMQKNPKKFQAMIAELTQG